MSKRLYQLALKLAPKIGNNSTIISTVYPKLKTLIRKEYWYFGDKFTNKVDLIILIIYIIGVLKKLPYEVITELVKEAKIVYVFEVESLDYMEDECETCGGAGQTFCEYCNDGTDECDRCDGTGDVKCEVCDGEGEINFGTDEVSDCEECGGRGLKNCEDCDGRGHIDCENCDGSGRVECDDCYGNGMIETEAIAYTTWVYLSWDKEFNNECDIKMEMKEPIVLDESPLKAIILYELETGEELDDSLIEIDKLYCYRIKPLDELTNNEVDISINGLNFSDIVPLEYKKRRP